jgi:F-type H+-transporting ATPase subunit alpha
LSIDLFLSGVKPAIDVGLSVTRVGSAAQWSGTKLVAGSYKLDLAQFSELQAFAQFASDLGEDTMRRLANGEKLVRMFTQFCGAPMSLGDQVSILSLASQGILDTIRVDQVTKLLDIVISVPSWLPVCVPVRQLASSVSRCLG